MQNLLLASLLAVSLFAPSGAACPVSANCPIHDTFSGTYSRDSYVDGKHLKWFKCTYNGHEFYVVC